MAMLCSASGTRIGSPVPDRMALSDVASRTMKNIFFNKVKSIIKSIIRPLVNKNYFFAKAYYHFRFYFSNLRSREPLLIYQTGKVGSSTVLKSVKALDLDMPIFHIHTLTPEGMAHGEAIHGHSLRSHFPRSKHLLESRYLRREVDRGLSGKRWKVVTLVREPVARNISSLFQIIDLLLPNFIVRYESKSIKLGELTELFLEQYPVESRYTNWFDLELKPVFGIDVFSSDFPTSKGYKVYEGENAQVLVLKLENLNKCAQDAFKEFLNIDQFTLIEANISRGKAYYVAYEEFLDAVVLPAFYIEEIYTLKYVQHFYSEEEINAFKAKWYKKNRANR
jgi:hypothetical protein